MHDHIDAANSAIRESIWDDHDDIDGGWRDLIPENAPLNYADEQAWRNFAGRVVKRFNLSIASCSCLPEETFFDLKSKELIEFRNRLRESVTCN